MRYECCLLWLTRHFGDIRVSMAVADVLPMSTINCNYHGDMGWLPHVLVPQQNCIVKRFLCQLTSPTFAMPLVGVMRRLFQYNWKWMKSTVYCINHWFSKTIDRECWHNPIRPVIQGICLILPVPVKQLWMLWVTRYLIVNYVIIPVQIGK